MTAKTPIKIGCGDRMGKKPLHAAKTRPKISNASGSWQGNQAKLQ